MAGKGEANRETLRERGDSGEPPGRLAYVGGTPVGRCSVGPRNGVVGLERSRVLAPVDDVPVWAVPGSFVAPGANGRGISVALLEIACESVGRRGGAIVEG